MLEDYQRVQAQIVEKAQALFARFGFRKTTMDEIAQAAHKGKSTIYHYFQNKEEIFRAVVEKEANELKKRLIRLLPGKPIPCPAPRLYSRPDACLEKPCQLV